MKLSYILRTAILVALLSNLSLSPGMAQNINPPFPGDDSGSPKELSQASQPDLPDDFHIERHAGTGLVRFLTSRSGIGLSQPQSLLAGATSMEAAQNFLDTYGYLFGLDSPRQQLQKMREKIMDDGRSFVRLQQVYHNIPVMGGELIAQVDSSQNIRSIQGEISPDIQVQTQARLSQQTAISTALTLVARQYGVQPEELQTTQPELWIYNPELLGAPGPRIHQLVWRMEISAVQALDIREFVLINAELGSVSLHFSMIDSTKSRFIYNNNNDYNLGLPGSGPVRVEGGPTTGIGDVDRAYDYAGVTYDFYSLYHLRDSIDDIGMKLVSTVNYCPSSSSCPYNNAFWNGSQMVYGQGYASADDVVAHELTHGVTEHESNLFYYMQSGAINEAFSDIWGELVDLSFNDGYDNDDPSVRWLLGEDLPGSSVRSMSNPPDFGDPDKMTSPWYFCGSTDMGGVHTNSGVANKAAYLMVDGGTFNGYTIAGLGIPKTIRIWYEVQTNLLTSASDYQDLNSALSLACTNLVGYYGITDADCNQVRKATAAVEMHRQPTSCAVSDVLQCTSVNSGSTFNGSSTGWTPVSGAWLVDANYYYTSGIASDVFSSSAYTSKSFGDFEYKVNLRRFGNNGDSNGLIIRGQPAPLGGGNRWHSGYGFYYSRNGQFAVYRYDNGVANTLSPWQIHSAILTGDNWNELKVVAQKDHLEFYINNALVWSGLDSTYLFGQNGISMYRSFGSTGDLLQADWAYTNGGSPVSLLKDDFENPTRGLWYSSAAIGANVWYYPQTDNPYGFDATYASSGAYNLWGYDIGARSDSSINFLNGVNIPSTASTFMSFKHAYAFEGTSTFYDGGVLEYSANGGAWVDAGSLINFNGYTGVITNSYDNPLMNRSAFTGQSHGMLTTRLNLSSLAGKSLRFRFRLGTDSFVDNLGWFIDDVDIYTCANPASYNYLPLISKPGTPPINSFHNDFNESSYPWTPISGSWTVSSNHYRAESTTVDNWVTASYSDLSFNNFSYTARVKRAGCTACTNRLIIRGTPNPLGTGNQWYNAYSFHYGSSGIFSVWKYQNGVGVNIVPWTAHTAIFTGEEWNVVKVIAIGSALQFYINNVLVWSGSDPTFSAGRVGLGLYHLDSPWDIMFVDWAQLSVISSSAPLETQAVVPGMILPGGSPEMSPQP